MTMEHVAATLRAARLCARRLIDRGVRLAARSPDFPRAARQNSTYGSITAPSRRKTASDSARPFEHSGRRFRRNHAGDAAKVPMGLTRSEVGIDRRTLRTDNATHAESKDVAALTQMTGLRLPHAHVLGYCGDAVE